VSNRRHTGHYIIRGGVEGKKRLEVLARVMWPTTARVLQEAGLAPGMRCLDLGCGGGDVTLQLATSVGQQGEVVGLDIDRIKLDLARQMAAQAGLGNVRLQRLNMLDWVETSQYDFIYCRFLLTHLAEPLGVLRQIRRALRPGGVAVVEDIDFSGHFCHPECAGFDAYVRLYRAAVHRQGADADIGPKLYGMLLKAGWRDVRLNVVQPTFASGEGKEIALLTLINIADSLLREKLTTKPELQAVVDDLTRFTHNATRSSACRECSNCGEEVSDVCPGRMQENDER
jgi:ubiquinone/menaquinone biosynthesis C-methylase UbiE